MTSERQFSLFGGGGAKRPGGEAPAPTGTTAGSPEGRTAETAVPDGRTAETAIGVSALNHAARRLIEDRAPQLWVRGEVANLSVSGAGHRYFSLRDERAQVECVLFQGDAWRLPADPEDGMEVLAFGQPTLFEPRGRFQLRVRTVQAAGEGVWRLAFQRLYRRLDAEGLFAPDRKRRPPPFPRRIGVVTSTQGAALRDVLTVLRRRSPWVHVLVHDCRVQGEGAALDIRDALERMGSVPGLDALILTRGGGAIEDLWCFNEEIAVRAVAACPVPVICGVGHEVDVTLAELVADVRAPTPSVAAELAAPDRATLERRLAGLGSGLGRGLRRRVARGAERVRVLERRLPRAALRRLERGRARVAVLAGRLDALSPLDTLARGYAVATGPDGKLLSRTRDFAVGAAFRLRVRDGSVEATADRLARDPES